MGDALTHTQLEVLALEGHCGHPRLSHWDTLVHGHQLRAYHPPDEGPGPKAPRDPWNRSTIKTKEMNKQEHHRQARQLQPTLQVGDFGVAGKSCSRLAQQSSWGRRTGRAGTEPGHEEARWTLVCATHSASNMEPPPQAPSTQFWPLVFHHPPTAPHMTVWVHAQARLHTQDRQTARRKGKACHRMRS